jgi:hypothetical protein
VGQLNQVQMTSAQVQRQPMQQQQSKTEPEDDK